MRGIPLKVLIVEDSEDDAEIVLAELRRGGYAPVSERVETAAAMNTALNREAWDVILSDFTLPRFSGKDALVLSLQKNPDLPFIFVSGTIGEAAAVASMKSGAHDYVMKDNLSRLAPAIQRELREAEGRRERRKAEEALRRAHEELESRVQERTAQLSEANRKLREEIAERKRAEEDRDRMSAQLLQGQKLQALGQLAAGIAHEINNPLAYILSNATSLSRYFKDLANLLQTALEMADRKKSGKTTKRIRQKFEEQRAAVGAEFLLKDMEDAVEESRKGGERIRDIIRNLTDFSHPDKAVPKEADLNAILESALRLCSNQLKTRVEVRLDCAALPPTPCYPQRMEQVFVNLIINAAQAIRDRGEIFVSTRVEAGHAVIRIRDTGCGIPPENMKRLFEPFFTTKSIGQGTGLGLHLAYKIVTAHAGRIDVASKVDQGAEFAVHIPLSRP